MGESLTYRKKLPNLNSVENIDAIINDLFFNFNLLDYGFESLKDFKNKLKDKYREIFFSKKFDFGTINSLPQIYTLYKSFELLERSEYDFDLVFRCRFDSIFIHPIKLFPLNKILSNNYLYNLNFGRAYYPKRIYDIFFCGSRQSMNFISSLWNDVLFLVNDSFDNGLDKRDCCRLLYLASTKNSTKVKSFPSRICDFYRSNKYIYSKYLINSHLLNLRFNKKCFLLIYIFKWFKEMKLNNIKISIYLFQAFLLLPFAYLKRLKYLKINLIFFY